MAGIGRGFRPVWTWGAGEYVTPSPLNIPATARYRSARGVIGGTFDPPHVGHLILAEFARSELNLSEVVFVPAAQPPHKLDRKILPIEHRLAMVRLAIATNPHFALSKIDIERPGPNYTVETLSLLRERWGETVEIFFIMGLDSLVELPTWHQPTRLIQLCRLAVMARPGYQVDMAALERAVPGLSERLIFIPAPLIGISSTNIKERVSRGETITYLVPRAVEAYIHDHRLYRDL